MRRARGRGIRLEACCLLLLALAACGGGRTTYGAGGGGGAAAASYARSGGYGEAGAEAESMTLDSDSSYEPSAPAAAPDDDVAERALERP
ncbi:MAG: hypothetical protein M3Y87_23135, partial [Myxococcota bacterium]|nr:hypothetical protein [Myxococcota bacterium]